MRTISGSCPRYLISILLASNPLSRFNLSIYYEIILDKTFLALYLFFCISCKINEYNSFWILFIDSIPLQLQTDGTLLGNRSVPTGLNPLYKKWLRAEALRMFTAACPVPEF